MKIKSVHHEIFIFDSSNLLTLRYCIYHAYKLMLKCQPMLAFLYLSHDMRFPTMWYVRPAKAQTSLYIRAV